MAPLNKKGNVTFTMTWFHPMTFIAKRKASQEIYWGKPRIKPSLFAGGRGSRVLKNGDPNILARTVEPAEVGPTSDCAPFSALKEEGSLGCNKIFI
jgi:hypothetical protein